MSTFPDWTQLWPDTVTAMDRLRVVRPIAAPRRPRPDFLKVAVNAYEQHIRDNDYDCDDDAPMAAALRALSDAIIRHHPNRSGGTIARLLYESAGLPDPGEPDPDDHPSLTARERNPNLR